MLPRLEDEAYGAYRDARILPELARLRGSNDPLLDDSYWEMTMAGDASKDGLREGTFNEGGEEEGEGVLEMLTRRASSPLEERPSDAINSTKEGSADMALCKSRSTLRDEKYLAVASRPPRRRARGVIVKLGYI